MAANTVGQRLKSFRQQKNLSVGELAQRAGLNPEYLRNLEESLEIPPIGPLLKLARLLGTRLGTFLDDHTSRDPLLVRQADRTRTLMTLKGEQESNHYYPLGQGKNDRHMEPFFIELGPDGEQVEISSHEGEEFVVVLNGEALLQYGPEQIVLKPGDSAYYNSCVPHKLTSAGPGKAEIYAVLYQPE